MLKRIHKDQSRIGMFVESLEGNWLSHPFWRTRFKIDSLQTLKSLTESHIDYLWINTSRGLDTNYSTDQNSSPASYTSSPQLASMEERPSNSLLTQRSEEYSLAAQTLNTSKTTVIDTFREARLGNAIRIKNCMEMVSGICCSLSRDQEALISLARLKSKDEYTYLHSVTVCALMVALARQLGLNESEQREAGLAGMLHDIGKVNMPDEILNKPGALSETEFATMQTHPQAGYEILSNTIGIPEVVLDVCLHHHERVDGRGYPHGLKGGCISLYARMAAICDVYDAITSRRAYKDAWDAAGSLSQMATWTGHFDPAIFQAFVKVVGIYPVGSLVSMESGHLAVVIKNTPSALTNPIVKFFYDIRTGTYLTPVVVDLTKNNRADKIVKREEPSAWGIHDLESLWRQ